MIKYEYVCRCGYEADVRDSCGATPLMDASRSNAVEMVEFLISQFKVVLHRQETGVILYVLGIVSG